MKLVTSPASELWWVDWVKTNGVDVGRAASPLAAVGAQGLSALPVTNSFTMPLCDVAVTARFRYVGVELRSNAVDHASAKFYTNGVEVAATGDKSIVVTNTPAVVVYTADNGWFFEGGKTVVTNDLDTAKNPATGDSPAAPTYGTARIVETGVRYVTVQAAVNAAASGQTVQMLTNSTENVTFAANQTNTLDLAGWVLKGTGSGSVVTVSAGANLTVTDTVATAVHYYTVDSKAQLWNWNDANATDAVPYENLTARPAKNAVVTVKGGAITGGNMTGYGGGILVGSNATLTLGGGNLVGNKATLGGGGVAVGDATQTGGSLLLNAGIVCGNVEFNSINKTESGGGVYVAANSALTMNGGDVAYNYAAFYGGGIGNRGVFKLTGGSIFRNRGQSSGGGIFTGCASDLGSAFTMTGGMISGNESKMTAGGLGSDAYAIVRLLGGSIITNKSAKAGGVESGYGANASYTLGGDIKITGNTLSDGKTPNNLYFYENNTVAITNDPALASTALIGMTTETAPAAYAPVAITSNGEAADLAYFTSDNAAYVVKFETDHLILSVPDVSFVPSSVDHATAAVYTNDAPVEKTGEVYLMPSNATATVVYTAEGEYFFDGGVKVVTNEIDTTVNPAVNKTVPKVLDPVKYVAPTYKGTDNNPTNGIAYWTTNTVYNYTIVTSAAKRVTWGTAGAESWYVVSGDDVQIKAGVVCTGDVHLVLCDGAKLTVTNAYGNWAGILTDTNGTFTVYGQTDGLGSLEATGGDFCAGIGGMYYSYAAIYTIVGDGSDITINGGKVTARGGGRGAGIGGGGFCGGLRITVNGGEVTAIGGWGAAGIGGGSKDLASDNSVAGVGSGITVNGGTVTATGGEYGAGIGGGSKGVGFGITINDGTVSAMGGLNAAGIGGGGNGTGTNIVINGGKVTAESYYYGAGIGGGFKGDGLSIAINGGKVTAAGGTGAAGIGGGVEGLGADITISNAEVLVSAPGVMTKLGPVYPQCIGDGAYAESPASGNLVAETARVFFNVTGCADGIVDDQIVWDEPVAPMPESFEGFVVMTPGTQTVDRVLVGGFGDGAQGLSALPAFALTNAVTGATSNITVNAAEHTDFANVFLRLTDADGNLTLKVEVPEFAITQQPVVTNLYTIAAETDGSEGITNYRWCILSERTMGFVALTNALEAAGESSIGGYEGTSIKSCVEEGVDAVQLFWFQADNPGDLPGLPEGGKLYFTCSSDISMPEIYAELIGPVHRIEGTEDEWVWEAKAYNYGDLPVYLVMFTADAPFAIDNLRWVTSSYTPVAEGAALTTFPSEKGEIGSNYLCRVSYGHHGTFYTADSEEFEFHYPIVARPTVVPNATATVYTNGVLSAETTPGSGLWNVWSNETATVVYTAEGEYFFDGGVKVVTNEIDTTVNPAVNKTVPKVLDPVKYTAPVYKGTDNIATNGIAYWTTNTLYGYTIVTSAADRVTWNAGWYVVLGNDIQIDGGVECAGDVRLVLCDGAKLTTEAAENSGKAGIAVSGEVNALAVHAGSVSGEIAGTGALTATGRGGSGTQYGAAGIGGNYGAVGSHITINGGVVTTLATADEGAGIGGGGGAGGSDLTINGGSVVAGSYGNGAGIGGGSGNAGSDITINGGTVTATNGVYGAGIGGGGAGNGLRIVINDGVVTAIGGDHGAGIGGGHMGSASDITINGGTVTAIGPASSAGIGGGNDGDGSNIAINGGTVTAVGGSAAGAAIGGGYDGSGSDIAIRGGTVFVQVGMGGSDDEYASPDFIGHGMIDVGEVSASNITIADTARVFFNMTGIYDIKKWQQIEPAAPMPETFDGNFVVMTRGTQVVDRVLAGGCGGAQGLSALPWTLTNAVTGATGTIEVNGAHVDFANVYLLLTDADGNLTLKLDPPAFAIDQQPNVTNLYTIVATTDGSDDITNYAWCARAQQVTDFHSLTNLWDKETRENQMCGEIEGTVVPSCEFPESTSKVVALFWSADDLPAGGAFHFMGPANLIDFIKADDPDGEFDYGTLSPSENGWIFTPNAVEGVYQFGLSTEDGSAFAISNLTYEVAVYTPVAEGKDLTTFPPEKGEVGSNYVCRVTYGHHGTFYTADSETFEFHYPIVAQPTVVPNATATVYTNGVLSAETAPGSGLWHVWSNETATVVYTAAEGWFFEDGVTAITNALDTLKNPATGPAPATPKMPLVTVTVTGQAITNAYDGAVHENVGFEWTATNPAFTTNDFTFAGISNIVLTSVGETNMYLKSSDFALKGDRFWGATFEIAQDGSLVITQCCVTVTSRDKGKLWDGTPLAVTAEDITVAPALPEGESFVYGDFASITDVGTTPASFSIAAGEGTKLSNYAISCVTGTLTVVTVPMTLTITQPSEGGVLAAYTNAVSEATRVPDNSTPTALDDTVFIVATPTDWSWQVEWVKTNDVAFADAAGAPRPQVATNSFVMPLCEVAVTGSFVVSDAYRADASNQIETAYAATTNKVANLPRLTDDEKQGYLDEAKKKRDDGLAGVVDPAKRTPTAVDDAVAVLIDGLSAVEKAAQAANDAKPWDLVIAANDATLPEPYESMPLRYASFAEAFTNETYVPFATNLHVFGYQTITEDAPMVFDWTLDFVTYVDATGATNMPSVTIATADCGEGFSQTLVNITNKLDDIVGDGVLVLSVTNGTPGAATYKQDLESLIGEENVSVLYTNFEPERKQDVSPETGNPVVNETLTVDEKSKVDEETGAIVLPGLDTSGKATVEVKDGATNDVVVAGKLVSREWDVVIVNETTNTLTVGAVETGMNVLITNMTEIGTILTLDKVIAGKKVNIDNNGHLEATVNASDDLTIHNTSLHTLVGEYRAGGTIHILGEYGSLSNVVVDATGTLTLTGTNVVSGPVTLMSDTSIVNESDTELDWSVAGDNHTTMIDWSWIAGSSKFGVILDAAQTDGDVNSVYTLATNATTAAGKTFVLSGGSVPASSTLKVGDPVAYVGAKAYRLWLDGDRLMFSNAWGKFAVEFHAMGGMHANGLEIATNDCYVNTGYVLPAVTREGYELAGWYVSWSNGVASVTNKQPLVTLAAHSLYAQWTSLAPTPTGGLLALADLVGGQPNMAVAKGTYSKNTSLETLVTPLYLTSIGDYAFNGNTKLKKITLTAARSYDDLSPVAVSIGRNAFSGCSSLEEVRIAAEVSNIGQSAFQNSTKLKKLVFQGDGTITYGTSAFYRCGWQDGSVPFSIYMSSAFQANNAALIAQIKKWNTTAQIVLKVDVRPIDGEVAISGLDLANLSTDRKLAVVVKTSVQGTPDPDDVDVEYTATLSPASWSALEATKTAHADGTVTVEVTVPEGDQGYLRATVR